MPRHAAHARRPPDQLAIDGVNIPNTNIAANVGPQIAPSDTDQIEVQRGSYAADIGDRTYGVFNVAPRNGFERDREAELHITGGNFYTGETALSAGDHSQKTAWYASVAAARSNYGLETPIAAVVHDATNSQSGFGSFLVNPNATNQFRFNGQLRQDFFQVPVDPNENDWLNQLYDSSGFRDGQTERDAFFIADWVHTLRPQPSSRSLPFTTGTWPITTRSATDLPTATTCHHTSNYAGLQASVRGEVKRNNLAASFYSFYQHDSSLFGVVFNDGSATTIHETDTASGGNVEGSFSDSYRVTDWLTLLAGVRLSSFHGAVTENYADPRFGATLSIPRLNWVLRGFYGRYYQAPPLVSIQGPLLAYANANNTGFTSLRGERDEEHEFSIQIPYRGWALEVDNFKTRINNFLDHSNIGESNVFIPITVDGALVRAWEATLRSPSLWRRGQFHLAYSNQIAEQRGAINGGLICISGCDDSFDYSPGRSRPAPNAQHRLYRHSADAQLVLKQCLLRLRLLQRHRRRDRCQRQSHQSLPGKLSAGAYHLRRVGRQNSRRELQTCCHGRQRHQPSRAHRQFADHWRLPLQRPATDIRRTALPIPFLSDSFFVPRSPLSPVDFDAEMKTPWWECSMG